MGGFCSDFTTGDEDEIIAFSHFLRFYVCDDVDLQRQSSMRCSSRRQQRFLGHTDSSSIAWPRHHIRHVFFGFYNHLIDTVWSSPLLRFPPIDALGMSSVCHIYTLAYFLQGAAVRSREFFLCKVGMKQLCGKGAFLLSQKFFRKMGVPTFFQAHEG